MHFRVCICCGQQMAEQVDNRSWQSHVCAACAALADEVEELDRPKKKTRLSRIPAAMLNPERADPSRAFRRARLR